MTKAEQYAKDVISGQIVTGNFILQAANRFMSWLDRDDIYFDEELAEKIVNFSEQILYFWEGQWRGKPVVIYPWQAFILQNIFCWKRTKDDSRLIRTAYIQIARKNGKTTMAAIISFIHLILDEDLTPQIFIGANNEDQAKICSNTIGNMALVSPALNQAIQHKQIDLYQYKGKYLGLSYRVGKKMGYVQAMSKNPETKDGFNPSLGIIDEYHEAKSDALLNVIATGQGARKDPLLITVTTAGFNKHGVCYQQMRKTSIKILNGTATDDTYFPMIYELDSGDDWKEPKNWIKSNPMITHVNTLEGYLAVELNKAINMGATTEVNFKTKNLNYWTDTASVWIPNEVWIANHNPKLSEADLDGLPCYGGLDLAATRDMNAFNLLFPNVEVWGAEKHAVLLKCWLPEDNIHYRSTNYISFVKSEHIKTTPGNHANQRLILDDIAEWSERYEIERIHYDKYLANWLAPEMAELDLEVYPIGMGGFNLSQTMKAMEIEIAKHNVEHFNNPVHAWNLANCEPKRDHNGNIRPDKSNPENKIDATVAMILAFDAWISAKAEEKIYSDIIILE